ncbi:MAG: glycosyltransferase family 87 protein, partial [Thermoplasmata archaeon]
MIEKRSWSIALSVVLIVFSFASWLSVGYLNLGALILVWILLVLAGIAMINAAVPFSGKVQDIIVYSSIFISLLLIVFISKTFVSSYYGEDEIAIQKYAASIFLQGKDPYIKSNMIGLFNHYNVPLFETPMLTGGNVYYLLYPGLSVLLVIPSVLFRFSVDYVIVFFEFLALLLLIYYYKKNGMKLQSPLIMLVIMVFGFYIGFTVTGVTSIIWVFFLAAAYVFRKRPYIAGMFYGLSIGYKQNAIIIIPFLLYFLYKEYGRGNAIRFTFLAVVSFLAVNLPFIIMGPYAWLSSIISIGNQGIIGVSTGPSILSFAGFVNVSPVYFSVLVVIVTVFLLYVYIAYYESFKYAFFAFPIFIMLVNYRLMISYLMYWPYLVILIFPDLKRDMPKLKRVRINKTAFAVLAVVLIVVTSSFVITSSQSAQPLKIEDVGQYEDNISVPGMISAMNVSLYYSPTNGESYSLPVNFRIFLNEGLKNFNSNSLLWHADTNIIPGRNNVTIYPNNYFDILPDNVSFRIEAYYSSFSSYFNCAGAWVKPEYPIENPGMMYPSYIKDNPFPGWYFESESGN